MAEYKLVMPKMGESVIEATILAWHKNVGDTVNENEIILEVATDKVDSEVPSPVTGVVKQLLHEVNEAVGVGEALAIIEVEGDAPAKPVTKKKEEAAAPEEKETVKPEEEKVEETKKEPVPEKEIEKTSEEEEPVKQIEKTVETAKQQTAPPPQPVTANQQSSSARYYSPLVLNIAQVEHISMQELEGIAGTGADNRVTKEDILEYLEKKKKGATTQPAITDTTSKKEETQKAAPEVKSTEQKTEPVSTSKDNIEIIEMDRMRKLIAQHMVNSKKTSAHVSSIVECDVTNLVRWRDKHKEAFQKREGFSLSFMPIFVEAITRAIKDYPMVNISVDGDKILRKKDINIGIATALPSGNLIVPVIRNTDQKSLLGISKAMNTLVQKARSNSLQPDDIADGTYTITNIGSFGNIIGTPIINQPQVAIMAVGAITKKPVVLDMDGQDVIAIRHMMYLSHTFDHRVVDGMLGGLFVKKVADFLEKFDLNQEI